MPLPISNKSLESSLHSSLPQVFITLADPIVEKLYQQAFQASQYCVVWHAGSRDLSHVLLSVAYDVIVLDLSFFSSDPIHTLREVKRISPDSEIIILAHTDDVRLAIAAFNIGISDYFLKPTNPETLAWAIEKNIRRKEFQSRDEALSADLSVFRISHQINMSENDHKMRELTAHHLVEMAGAGGAIWVWKVVEGTETRYKLETFNTSYDTAELTLRKILLQFPNLYQDSSTSQLTSHPENWFRENHAWIPLRAEWMGAVSVFETKKELNGSDLARAEFLIRNLELSLENYTRYAHAKQMTYIDDLTGLYNARYLDLALNAATHPSRMSASIFSVLFIDIDHFKHVNDQNGHLVGSQLLVEVATILKRVLRQNDHSFRYGGDEFIAVLYGTGTTAAMEVAERIRSTLERTTFHMKGIKVKITVSIGVASFPEHGKDKKTILEMADHAMYDGKNSGRNTTFLATVWKTDAP